MITSTLVPHTVRAVALVAAIAITTGCARTDPYKRLQAAQDATLDAGSSAFVIEQSLETAAVGNQKVRTEGVLDFARRVGRATVTMIEGEANVVFAGDMTYFRLPASLHSQKPWIRIDRQDIEKFSGLENVSDDPRGNLDLLDGVVGAVERVGEEDVRGVRTTHYRVTVDLGQAVKKASPDRRNAVQRQAALLGGGQLPMELWLDGKGRIARQTFAIDLQKLQPPTSTPPANSAGTVRTLIEYYDFGVKVHAEPPPDAQVIDFKELQGG
jgi:hypothetical protein